MYAYTHTYTHTHTHTYTHTYTHIHTHTHTHIYISLSTVVLNSRDHYENAWLPENMCIEHSTQSVNMK